MTSRQIDQHDAHFAEAVTQAVDADEETLSGVFEIGQKASRLGNA